MFIKYLGNDDERIRNLTLGMSELQRILKGYHKQA